MIILSVITVNSIEHSIKSEKFNSLKSSAKIIDYKFESWKSENIYRTIIKLTENSKNILNDTSFNPESLIDELKSEKDLINYRSEISAIIYNDSLYETGTNPLLINKETLKNKKSSFYDKESNIGYLILPASLKSGNPIKFIFKIDYRIMLSEAVKLIDLPEKASIGIVNNFDLIFLETRNNSTDLENHFEITASKINSDKIKNEILILEGNQFVSTIFYDEELNLLINISVDDNSLFSVFYFSRFLIFSALTIIVIIALVLMFALSNYRKGNLKDLEKSKNILEKQISLRTKDLAKANANIQRNAKRFKAVIENAGDAIITVYENGIIRYFNKTAENIFNYDDDEIKGRHFNFLLPRRERRYFNMLLNRFKKNPEESLIGRVIEVNCKRKDGSIFPAEMSLSEIEFEEKHLFTCIIKDITIRKKFEAQLLEASKAADRANEAKSDFLASMSHELRTPLNGILGYAQILERDKLLTEKQLKGITVIKNSGEHLLSLINDILDLSKIEAQKFELHKTVFNLEEQLKTVCSLIKIKTDQKNIDFEINRLSEIPKIVFGDSKVIKQIFLNILGNAVKFTDNGKIKLNIGYRNSTESILFIEIEDTGIGIEEEKISEIFEPFKQIQSGNKIIQGTGLGLSITKKLIALMNGRIQVESKLNIGSKFTIEIQLETSNENININLDETPNIIGFGGEKKNILAVDDNITNLDLYDSILSELGFEIEKCESAKEALSKLNKKKYDLILMDLIMPELNGYDAAKQIKANQAWTEIPIIVVSASTLASNNLLYDKSTFNNYLLKPFNNNELINLIGEHLNIEWKYENISGSIDNSFEDEINYPDKNILSEILKNAEFGDFKKIEERLSDLSSEKTFNKFINLTNEYIKQYDDEGLISFLRNIEKSE